RNLWNSQQARVKTTSGILLTGRHSELNVVDSVYVHFALVTLWPMPRVFMAHNLILDALQILEEESVVAWGSIFWILPRWTYYCRPYPLQLRVQPVDFGTRCCFERQMM